MGITCHGAKMKEQVIKIYGANWLVKESLSLEAALDEIAVANCTGSFGSSTEMQNGKQSYLLSDVVRLDDNGCECLPYGEVGRDWSDLLKTPVVYIRLRAEQTYSGYGNIDYSEWFEICCEHDLGDDSSPAFAVYGSTNCETPTRGMT